MSAALERANEAWEKAQKAEAAAQRANDRHDSHDQLCKERQDQITKQLATIEKMVGLLFNRWWVISGSVIFLLLSILGLVVKKHLGW